MPKQSYEVTSEADGKLKPVSNAPAKPPATTKTSTSTAKKPNLEDDDSVYEVPLPPDGGWGWMVMFASFFTNLLVDGVCYTYTTIYQGVMETFDSTDTITALVGSLVPGVYLIVGPIVSVFMAKFGCRVVAAVGGVVSCVAFVLSAFSTNIVQMLFLYGILGGIGFGLMYLPSIVVVGYYFDKKRALATGIAVCGSGIGTFVLAPLLTFLVEEYGWRGCVVIVGGLLLNGIPFALIYRPLEPTKILKRDKSFEQMEMAVGDGSNQLQKMKNRDRTVSMGSTSDGAIITETNEVLASGDPPLHKPPFPSKHTPSHTKSSSRMSLAHSKMSLKSHHERQADVENPMLRKDALLIGSKKNLAEYKEVGGDVEEYTKKMVDEEAVLETTTQRVKRFLTTMFDFSLLGNVTFLLLAFSGVCVFTGLYTPFVYSPKKVMKDTGVSEASASIVLSVLGACNTISRIITGFISDRPNVDVIVIQNVAAILSGLATALVLFFNTYALMCCYAAFFGVFIAAFIALRSIVMVEMLGLERLNNAYGLTALFQGIAVLIGSPISGALYESTGDFTTSFIFSGILIALGGIICLPVRRIARWEKERERKKNGNKGTDVVTLLVKESGESGGGGEKA